MTNRKQQAFTLVELLVVMAILGVMIALLLPQISRASERANRSKCAANLKQMLIGFNMHVSDEGVYPKSSVSDPGGWMGNVEKYWGGKNDIAMCPSAVKNHGFKEWTLMMNQNLAGRSFGGAAPGQIPLPPTRATKTILCGDGHFTEAGVGTNHWTGISHDKEPPDFEHDGGANFIFCDGHLQYLDKQKALQPHLWDPLKPLPANVE